MKNFKNYLVAALACASFTSCIVDDEIDTNSELFNAPLITGFQDQTTLANFVQQAGATFDFGVPVNVIGGAAGQPSNSVITMNYSIGTLDDLAFLSAAQKQNYLDNSDLAIEGTHFDFRDSVQNAVINPTESFDLIDLDIYNDALDGGKTTYFVLNLTQLTSVDNVVIGEQRKSTIVTIQLCRTDLAVPYNTFYNTSATVRNHVISHVGSGNYQMDSMFGWPGSGYTSDFFACAGNVTFTGWVFSNPIIQGVPGTVNSTTGDVQFTQFGIGRSSGPPIYSGWTINMIKQ